MQITREQYERIVDCFPRQRGNVNLDNLQVLNAILYVAEHGCKWRGLPKHFGCWHSIYTRMNRWSKNGVLDRIFERLQQEQVLRLKIEAVSLDSTIVKVPRCRRGFKKTGPQAIGKSRGGWTTKLHMVAANAECALKFSLSPGNAHDAPEGRKLLAQLELPLEQCGLLMDMAYEGNETTQLGREMGFSPVVPPHPRRVKPWEYDRELYKRRNEIERLFRRLKGFRRVFTRFDKLARMYLAFVVFALIVIALK